MDNLAGDHDILATMSVQVSERITTIDGITRICPLSGGVLFDSDVGLGVVKEWSERRGGGGVFAVRDNIVSERIMS